jgi:preprotein translocase subunit SecB
MAKKENNDQKGQNNKPKINIIKQYIKDLSFEAPNSPKVFFEKQEGDKSPNVKFNIELKANKMAETIFNLDLKVNIQNVLAEKTLYLVELVYSGIVEMNVEKDKEQYYLLVEAARMLFPAVRTLVTNLTQESGFPPFAINYINFEDLYEKQVENQKKQ